MIFISYRTRPTAFPIYRSQPVRCGISMKLMILSSDNATTWVPLPGESHADKPAVAGVKCCPASKRGTCTDMMLEVLFMMDCIGGKSEHLGEILQVFSWIELI